jgi:hypothetical protein
MSDATPSSKVDTLLRSGAHHQLVELTNTLSKLGLAIFGAAYVIGLVIHSTHVTTYGLYYLDFLKVEYVMAGLLWIFLTSASYLYCYLLRRGIVNYWRTSPRSKLMKVIIYFWWLLSFLIVVAGIIQLFVSTNYRTNRGLLVVTGVLILNALAVYVFVSGATTFFLKLDKQKKQKINASEVLLFGLGAIVAITLYARYAFPKLSHHWGGGSHQSAVFLVRKEQLEAFGATGFVTDAATRRTVPVEIILEGSDFFFVIPPNTKDQQNLKGVRLPKESFDAVFYIASESGESVLGL